MTAPPDRRAATRNLLWKLVRFGVVGGTSTLLYAALTWLCVEKAGLRPTWAAGLAYLVLIPPNFIAHRYFTFDSQGNVRRESGRFAMVHILNLSLSVGGMALVEVMGVDYRFGIAFSAVMVPVIVFALMNLWVFRHQRSP